jgi:hypothetical protein
MKPTLFRQTVLVDGTGVVVALKDLGGAYPVTLYMENTDHAAEGRTAFGSKNANLFFKAASAGTLTKAIEIIFTVVAGQAFSTDDDTSDPYTEVYTVNLACDPQGVPTQHAYDVMDLINADPYSPVVASLAHGSDGSALMGAADITLSGDLDATALGTVTVEHSADVNGVDAEWDSSAAAGTAFSSLGANTTKAFLLDAPVRGLRVKASKTSANTYVTVSAVRALNA